MPSRLAAILAALALLSIAQPARAHEEMALHALTVLDSVEPSIDGLEVRVTHLGAPALAVRNETGGVLTVFDEADKPFLKIGPEGVRMNVASPFSYRALNPFNDTIPPDVKQGRQPSWVRVSTDANWTWFDPRLLFDESDRQWSVPMTMGATALIARGGFESLHGHGHFRSIIEPPEVSGLEMRLSEGPIPALFVRNETGEVLEVRGQAGEPMLRIGPKGVEANLRSPSYYSSAAQTIAPVPPSADAGARPQWKSVSEQPVWAWLEYRAAIPPELQQRDALGEERSTVLEWESPMRLDGEALAVTGRVEWLPPRAPAPEPTGSTDLLPWWIAAAAIVGGGVAFSTLKKRAVLA